MMLMRRGQFMTSEVCGVMARACLVCGYTMFYAADLPKIQEEARKHPDDFTT
jgi:hypothetical protein